MVRTVVKSHMRLDSPTFSFYFYFEISGGEVPDWTGLMMLKVEGIESCKRPLNK